ncbi:nacht ankyrin domain-containing protein [Fusarium denticulatum]|uniref:Nacht ankyrin domain-containing protein n=1 Tax=Fusarium denticulatum TaxID=48507 RepID=A0A8H5T977_9HYPO|nr:nacht ankyrin domain-containing protein [Fusarium denticulatum]
MADPSTYTVGWICALTTELVAAKSFFHEEYEVTLEAQAPGDNNSYSFGRMGRHDVAVACLPRARYGIAPAASVARDMLRTFPNIRVGLMVGIVSVLSGTKGGVLHHARGKTLQQQEFQLTGSLNQPPQFLLTAVGALEADYKGEGHEMNERIEEALSRRPRLRKRYARPSADTDRLYESRHIRQECRASTACKENCGEENLITRNSRGDNDDDPMVHYGLIASSDKLMKDITIRDKLAMEEGVLCFEMEAAGLMNHFPCLIIRGICDYDDSHKNKEWQGFTAMTAAAYANELLQKILPTSIQQHKTLAEVLDGIGIQMENITTSVRDTNATVNTMHADNQRQKIERCLKTPRSSTNVAKAKKRRHDSTGLWSRDSLLPWIGQLTEKNVQLLLTARPESDVQPQIVRFFGEQNCLSLDKTAVNGDIQSYILSVLDTNPRFTEQALSEQLRKDICIKVGEGADGMFRWAACQMDTLEACPTLNAVREALVSLPRDLPKTYDRMMESIPPQHKNDSIRLLQFMVNCEQPLSLAEAVEILATRPDPHHDRLRCCPGIIHTVTVESEQLDENDDMYRWEEVHLTHFPVKEYLTKLDAFCELKSAIVITEELINYLYDVKDPLYLVRADFPLAIRTENIWCEFARRAQTVEKIVQMTAKLLISRSNVLKLYRISQLQVLNWYCSSKRRGERLDSRSRRSHGRAEDGFSIACLGGLQSTVASMMEDTKFNVPIKEKEACLIGAILNKHPEVAEVLLNYGVNPDASNFNGSAIYNASKLGFTELASENGHFEVIEELLNEGYHVDIQNSLERTVEKGHTAITELLVSWGACEAEPISDNDVLEISSSRRIFRLVCRLLDARPDDYEKNKALLKACEAGRLDVIRLLISRRAQADHPIDCNYKHYNYIELDWIDNGEVHHNCLVLAAHSGYEDVVQTLLDNEFDLSQVLDLKTELEVTTSICVGKAFVRALLGCHHRVIITLLDAMENHAYTDEIAALRAASEPHNLHILREFSDSMKDYIGDGKVPVSLG